MLQEVFYPIMNRLDVPVSERNYILSFYINGMIAIITEWLKNDCNDTIEELINIILFPKMLKSIFLGKISVLTNDPHS